MSKKTLMAFVAAILVAAGVWYWASPYYAMYQLQDAAREGNKDALKEHVDFPAVRASMKQELRERLAAEMAKEQGDNPFGAMGMMFAMGLVGTMIDGMVTPEAIAAMVEHGRIQREGAETSSQSAQEQDWSVERDGLDTFRASPEGDGVQAGLALVFERDGLSWNLVGIELPENAVEQ